jgi:DNA polymerase III subunit epsilon
MKSQDQLSIFSNVTLNLTRPLAFFDLETTGTRPTLDRIVELSIVKVLPGDKTEILTKRVNPTIPIPYESSLVHGIYDKDVANEPTFAQLGNKLNEFLQGCDLGGFNIMKFDIPVLIEEFHRINIDFDISNRRIVDCQRIFHMMEPRTLSAAYAFYCNKNLEDAHSAEADTLASYEVLKAQIAKYKGKKIKDHNGKEIEPIQNDMNALHEFSAGKFVDLAGRMTFNDQGEEVINFGKYKSMRVTDVLKKDPGYYEWIMQGDFPYDTKKKLTEIKLRGLTQR